MKILLSLLLTVLPISLMAQTAAAPAAAPTKAEFVAAGEKLLAKLEEFSTALDTAKDGPTAEAAKPKLAKINKEIEALSRSAAAMGEPSPAMKQELDNDPKMRARAAAIMNKLVPLTQRIAADPAILPILQQTMKDFQRASAGGAAPEPPAGSTSTKPAGK